MLAESTSTSTFQWDLMLRRPCQSVPRCCDGFRASVDQCPDPFSGRQ